VAIAAVSCTNILNWLFIAISGYFLFESARYAPFRYILSVTKSEKNVVGDIPFQVLYDYAMAGSHSAQCRRPQSAFGYSDPENSLFKTITDY